METRREQSTSIGLLILRIGICAFMIIHGYGKYQMLRAGDFEHFKDPVGLVDNRTALILAVTGEFICPMLVAIGFLTRLATIPSIVVMGTAAFMVHTNDPWSMETAAKLFMAGDSKSWASKEPALLFLIPFVTLLFTGAGRLSVDGMIWPRRSDPNRF
jgi:putative oxidoreductase